MPNTEISTGAEDGAAPFTLLMVRDEPQFPGGPVEADVQPPEVPGFMAGGWKLAEGQTLPELPPEQDKPLADLTIEELRAVADAEGVSFTPRTGVDRLRADIVEARAKVADNG